MTPPHPIYGFRFCERASLPLPHDRTSVLWPSAPNGKRDWMKIQPSRPQCVNSHRILALTTGLFLSTPFGAERSCCCRSSYKEIKSIFLMRITPTKIFVPKKFTMDYLHDNISFP
ncbi:hypothetical protein AVEN_235771-1 [Araneus ventricosus]|uniref:Uncharacterized protein n=1 Tax=Araneus ventricosus TaxID=182803 RepID=A0A4Y2WBA8_ARAVE|nr:hypothetical protein AVEN_235771-1 [Araneus ventricosus]